MPDRSGDPRPGRDDPDALPDNLWAAEQRRRLAAAQATRAQAEHEQRQHELQLERDACPRCDHHGTGPDGLPCTHPRPDAAKRGMALIRSKMGWTNQPPQEHPKRPGESHSGTKNTPPNTNPHPKTNKPGQKQPPTPPAPPNPKIRP